MFPQSLMTPSSGTMVAAAVEVRHRQQREVLTSRILSMRSSAPTAFGISALFGIPTSPFVGRPVFGSVVSFS